MPAVSVWQNTEQQTRDDGAREGYPNRSNDHRKCRKAMLPRPSDSPFKVASRVPS